MTLRPAAAKFAMGLILMALLQGCSDEKPAGEKKSEATNAKLAALSPEVIRKSRIEIASAGPANIEETMTFYGTVQPNGEREQGVRARYPGAIMSVRKSVGEAVARGETLMTVESSESLQSYAIAAPISGTVLDRKVNPGQVVGADTVLMTVADLSTVWIDLAVFARDLGAIQSGMPARITTADGRNSTDTKLSFVAPAGDADNQSVVARAVVQNSGPVKWVPGQFVTGDVVVNSAPVPLAVRSTAIQSLEGKPTVFVEVPKGFEARTVETGRTSGQWTQIRSGLKAGERYAAANSYLVKAELSKGEAGEE